MDSIFQYVPLDLKIRILKGVIDNISVMIEDNLGKIEVSYKDIQIAVRRYDSVIGMYGWKIDSYWKNQYLEERDNEKTKQEGLIDAYYIRIEELRVLKVQLNLYLGRIEATGNVIDED